MLDLHIYGRSAVHILTSETRLHHRNRDNIQENNYMDCLLDQTVRYKSFWSSTIDILTRIGIQQRNRNNIQKLQMYSKELTRIYHGQPSSKAWPPGET